MKSALILATVLLAEGARFTPHHKLDGYTFKDYLSESGKSYHGEEYAKRLKIFTQNLEEIKTHNAKSPSYYKGVNKFTDQTQAELSSLFGGDKYAMEKVQTQKSLLNGKTVKLPASVDWRDHSPNVISPVKDQGSCGSCWAFAAVATIEAHVAINTGKLSELSPQELVSCMENNDNCGGTGGCQGATAELAFDYLATYGLSELWAYGYAMDTYWTGQNGDCKRQIPSPAATASGYTLLPRNDYNELMNAIATVGPIAVNVDASYWSSYESGVFNGCAQNDVVINHVVQLVGYGTDEVGGDYWLIRNSWSPEWGEDGYMKLARQSDYCGWDNHNSAGVGCDYDPKNVTVCGMCGVLYDSSFPNGATNVN